MSSKCHSSIILMVTYLLISLAYFQAVVLADDGAGDAGSTDNNSTSLAPTVFVDETAAEVPDDPASSSSPTISPTILEVLDNCPDYCAGGDDSSVDCLQGDATFDDHLQAVPPGASSTFLGPTNVDGYYCDCEVGRTGADCSIEYENCPDGKHTCYHGGTCVPAEGGQDYHCDCTSAQFEGKLHAGKFCEFKAQQDCDASNSFCVNDGVCLQNSEVNQACSCGSDWTGAHCEYKKSEAPTCDLDCQNQGTCQIGIPPSGLDHEGGIYDLKYCLCRDGYDGEYCEIDTTSGGPNDVVENNNPPPDVTACSLTCLNGGFCKKGLIDSSLLGLGPELSQFEPTKNDDLEHCECSDGWIGKHCEASVEVCGDNEHLCLHGSSCVLEPTTVEASWTCNCDDAHTDATLFAGSHCQHHHTTKCWVEGANDLYIGEPTFSFCVNDGSCITVEDTSGQTQPACECPDEYTGAHCELLRSVYQRESSKTHSDEHEDRVALLFTLLVVMILLVTVFMITFYRFRVKQAERRNLEIENAINSEYRDQPLDLEDVALDDDLSESELEDVTIT